MWEATDEGRSYKTKTNINLMKVKYMLSLGTKIIATLVEETRYIRKKKEQKTDKNVA